MDRPHFWSLLPGLLDSTPPIRFPPFTHRPPFRRFGSGWRAMKASVDVAPGGVSGGWKPREGSLPRRKMQELWTWIASGSLSICQVRPSYSHQDAASEGSSASTRSLGAPDGWPRIGFIGEGSKAPADFSRLFGLASPNDGAKRRAFFRLSSGSHHPAPRPFSARGTEAPMRGGNPLAP